MIPLILTATIFVLITGYLVFLPDWHRSPHNLNDVTEPATASRHKHHHFQAPRPNIWSDLTADEAEEVYNFLLQEWADLNITKTPKSGTDNFIVTIETLQPNKTQAVPFLFEQEADRPGRWAKVVLSHHTDDGPFLTYYAVGPLPVSAGGEEGQVRTKAELLTYPFHNGRSSVPNLMADFVGSGEFALNLAENVSDITTELLGAQVNKKDPLDPDSLQAYTRFTRLEADLVVGWIQFFRPGRGSSGRTLLPQGLYARVDASKEVSQWEVSEWWYNGQMFDDVDHLRSAIKAPDFLRTEPNVDGPWTDTEDFDSHPTGRELPPPVSIQPLGPRYRLDRAERFVSWFGFEFYFTSTQATGVSLFDIRFKGERVMYELSLQEALAHYAGDDPMAGGQEFLDTFFGMGTNAFELVPGYDCPAYADYLDSELHRSGRTEKLANNICLFEFTSDYLLARHTAQHSVTVSRNTFLTLRSVSTVGNYDYTIDYNFYLDGAIEVKVRASGYIYGAFFANNPFKNNDEYGHRIHDALSSSLHDHVISFKADLDVAGTANDMVRLAVEPTVISYPWDQPYVKERHTMHLKEYPVTHETGLDWPKNSGEFYIVYSADKKNAWGERRGYRIVSGTGMGNTPHLTITNSTSLGTSARWAERDVWVLRRKDEEPRAADPLNYLDTLHPILDFNKLADSEALRGYGDDDDDDDDDDDENDGDLVIYFNVGSHHVPHSGDIPNTLMHTSASAVMFVPHNFADRDPSRESVQGVRLQLKGDNSGGFAGFPDPGEDGDEGQREPGKSWPAAVQQQQQQQQQQQEDLKSRERRESGYKRHEGVNYFGTPYKKGVQVPLEALEPDLSTQYQTKEVRVSDLGLNGSAAGLWIP
ncbi:amine oxidase catalytic domain-containing protein [Cryphonectria parasitica EP155]|uniref:Amine oxidase n=1 Tax=Cryphonectria parasitica (strain ATCC 38755 / EP155) TaxID=660469 RepID=A0A9P4Y443_CRYP1|nr:amine oxidase catalytic domain-containing protein [Cryphonectria parasitica EP155]KAF3766181.1 amine oxidase catalytic domain-containing protein [Cryphonectria parasitica EP155]